MKPKTALIDGDLLIFQVAAACEYGMMPEEVDIESMYSSIENKVVNVVKATGADNYRLFLSEGNFRNFVRSDYKCNREDVWRPECLSAAREYAKLFMGAESVYGLEADDLMAIYQTEETIICTLDKDLRQVSGQHYRWATEHQPEEIKLCDHAGHLDTKKNAKGHVTGIKGHGWKFFCGQLLVGDSTDGIMGCGKRIRKVYGPKAKKAGQEYFRREGIGASEAAQLLWKCTTEREALLVVYEQYVSVFGKEDALQKMIEQGRLLWMVREMRTSDNGDVEALMWHPNPKVKEWMNIKTGEING